jgi:hypothetical protein
MGKDKLSSESSSSGNPEIPHSEISEADITESIDELDELIVETKLSPKLYTEIPVLNDIVDPAEARRYAQSETSTESSTTPDDKIEDFPIDRLNKLVDKVDKKLSNELDSLVDILKDTIKDSIIDELKEQLKKDIVQKDVSASRTDTQDKGPE